MNLTRSLLIRNEAKLFVYFIMTHITYRCNKDHIIFIYEEMNMVWKAFSDVLIPKVYERVKKCYFAWFLISNLLKSRSKKNEKLRQVMSLRTWSWSCYIFFKFGLLNLFHIIKILLIQFVVTLLIVAVRWVMLLRSFFENIDNIPLKWSEFTTNSFSPSISKYFRSLSPLSSNRCALILINNYF